MHRHQVTDSSILAVIMGLAEEALNTNERRAYGLVEPMFSQVSVGGEDEVIIMEQQSLQADRYPLLKGMAQGMADFLVKQKQEGNYTDEEAILIMTGFDMARIIFSKYIELEE